jgi:hypothetical protein
MVNFFIALWLILIFVSIGWYGFLVFYGGAKGWADIRKMLKNLEEINR